MKTHTELLFIVFFLAFLTIGTAQTSNITNADYDVTDDVVKIEKHIYSETTYEDIAKDEIEEKQILTFKKGLIETERLEHLKSNFIRSTTFKHSKALKGYEYDYFLIKKGEKENYHYIAKLITFKNLNFYFPSEGFRISKNIPDKELSLTYTSGTGYHPSHTFKVLENGLIEEIIATGHGPVVNTYNSERKRVKEFFPGLSGFDLFYDTTGLLKEKKQYNPSYKQENTNFYYTLDNRGNWIQKIAIKKDFKNNTTEKIKFSARKLTYKNGETTGSTDYNLPSIRAKLSQYANDVYSKPVSQTGCVVGDCQNGFGKKIFDDGATYEGNFQNGWIKGKGKITWVNGDIYEGDWMKNYRHGQGIYSYKNGFVYTGNFINNKMTGRGTLSGDGNKYTGEFLDGKFNGLGIYLLGNGNKIVAYWKDSKLDGEVETFNYITGKKSIDIYKEGKLIRNISSSDLSKDNK